MDTIVKSYLQKFGVSEATQTFLSKVQKMFIGGAWVDASDGQHSHGHHR
jgi:phenylacetaldehyde dehydrogenase